jgi:hypothetical protein
MPIAKEAETSVTAPAVRLIVIYIYDTMLIISRVRLATDSGDDVVLLYTVRIMRDGERGDAMNEYGANEKGTDALLLSQRVIIGHKGSIPVGRSIHVKRMLLYCNAQHIIKR